MRDEFFYRWNFDFNGEQPLWGYMHNVSVVELQPGTNVPQSIISTLRDETELREQELREEELTDKYKQVFEHSIIGLSFYSSDGLLLDANKEMRDICHFDSDTWDEYFSTMNLFDAMPFNELLDRSNVEEFWCCAQSIVPERGLHDYLEIHLHPIRDDEGELAYIALAVRNVTEERQMYLQAKLNELSKAYEPMRWSAAGRLMPLRALPAKARLAIAVTSSGTVNVPLRAMGQNSRTSPVLSYSTPSA